MNVRDIGDLWVPALKGLYNDTMVDKAHKLEKELGTQCYSDYLRRSNEHDFPMADDPAEAALIPILRALAGPHAKTLLKVWKIQKGRAA